MADRHAIHVAHLAVLTQFEHAYGRNDTRLASWQKLCRDVGVNEGTSITQCKKVFPSDLCLNAWQILRSHRI